MRAAVGALERNMAWSAGFSPPGSAKGAFFRTAASSSRDRTITGDSNPVSFLIALSTDALTLPRGPSFVKTTLPLWMYVFTSAQPACSNIFASAGIGRVRPPTLMARRNATYRFRALAFELDAFGFFAGGFFAAIGRGRILLPVARPRGPRFTAARSVLAAQDASGGGPGFHDVGGFRRLIRSAVPRGSEGGA